MLLLIDTTAAKKQAQAQLEANIKSALAYVGKLNIGFPAGNFDRKVYSLGDGELWAAFSPPNQDSSIKRYWNGFGTFYPNRPAQNITVEINIPLDTNSTLVAGFFAQDPASGSIYLMHSGKIGGGRPGIGKSAFLAWAKSELVEVAEGDSRMRDGIVIGNIDDVDLTARIWRFVQLVAGFKEAAAAGALDTVEFKARVAAFDRYRKEFSGRKRGKRNAGIVDYLSYHGDVVQALFHERSAKLRNGEEVVNSGLIDLFVKDSGRMTEIYEVKTSTARQALYTAIGQLITHSAGESPKRFIVLPVTEAVLPEFIKAFKELEISVRRFQVAGSRKKPTVTMLPT